MHIIKSTEYHSLQLRSEQSPLISSPADIRSALESNDCIGYYAYEGKDLIGFALLRRFAEKQYFLWDFIIDCRFQGRGKGKAFLNLLLDVMAKDYSAEMITTTYVYGNEIAKKLYESFGFTQTDIYCQDGIHEVNMRLPLSSKK